MVVAAVLVTTTMITLDVAVTIAVVAVMISVINHLSIKGKNDSLINYYVHGLT